MFCSEHPLLIVPSSRHTIPNILHFSFRTSDNLYIVFRTSGQLTGCSEEQGRKRTNPAQLKLAPFDAEWKTAPNPNTSRHNPSSVANRDKKSRIWCQLYLRCKPMVLVDEWWKVVFALHHCCVRWWASGIAPSCWNVQ